MKRTGRYLKEISISGFRGFATKQTIQIACPVNSKPGLTYILGPNNSGKTAIIEALNVIKSADPPSISEGKRNQQSGGKVEISIKDLQGNERRIATVGGQGCVMEFQKKDIDDTKARIFVVQARRDYPFFFGGSPQDRGPYAANQRFENRSSQIPFPSRLVKLASHKEEFNKILSRVMGEDFDWYIEKNDEGRNFLKVKGGSGFHGSEGLGHGIISLFVLLDAFYDSKEADIIAIDEPELSLHPQYIKKLKGLLEEYAKDRQIIIATHSVYLIDWEMISKGAYVTRVVSTSQGTRVHSISDEARKFVRSIIANKRNPHILGLDASDVFFIEKDGILITEGQDDVVYLDKVLDNLSIVRNYSLFGWGAGGADNIKMICRILADLGFEKVAAIVDRDRSGEEKKLRQDFPNFKFFILPADDIRTKKAVGPKNEKKGLLDGSYVPRPEFRAAAEIIFKDIAKYLG